MSKDEAPAKIFRRELITALMFYFPLMIITANILMPLKVPTEVILLLPLVALVVVAYIRTKYYHGVDYKPNTKNLSALVGVASTMFLLEKVVYSVMVRPDFYGIVTFFALLVSAFIWYKSSKDNLNVKTLAQMLILVSAFFIFVWSVFAVIVRAVYSLIVLLSWILLFLVSLVVVIRASPNKRGD